MPNFTDVGVAGMHYLNSELHRLRKEVAVVGEGSARFQQLMEDMIDKKIKLGALSKVPSIPSILILWFFATDANRCGRQIAQRSSRCKETASTLRQRHREDLSSDSSGSP
jgi:hypothetical protein